MRYLNLGRRITPKRLTTVGLEWVIKPSGTYQYLQGMAVILFWICTGLLIYAYPGNPLLLWLVSLSATQIKKTNTNQTVPPISIVIPCYNEDAVILGKVRQTLALDYPKDKLEVIVVSDGSTDRTAEVVGAITDPRVRLIALPQRRGKTYAQNAAVQQSSGEFIVFSDATTVYDPQALQFLAANYQDPHVGAVSGRYKYISPKGTERAWGAILFWHYENVIKMLQSRIRTLTGCSGCIYSVRKSLYQPLDDRACSDLVEPLCIVQKGYRVAFESRALAYEEITTTGGDEFRMRVRVVTQGITSIARMSDLLRIWKYGWTSFQILSHKVLRWCVPVLLLGILAASMALAGETVYRQFLVVQLVFYGYALLSLAVPLHLLWRPLGLPLYFCISNVAVFASIFEILRGREFVVWDTVRRKA